MKNLILIIVCLQVFSGLTAQQVKKIVGWQIIPHTKDTVFHLLKEYSKEGRLLRYKGFFDSCERSYQYDSQGRVIRLKLLCDTIYDNGVTTYQYLPGKRLEIETTIGYKRIAWDSLDQSGRLTKHYEKIEYYDPKVESSIKVEKYTYTKNGLLLKSVLREKNYQVTPTGEKPDTTDQFWSFYYTNYTYLKNDSLKTILLTYNGYTLHHEVRSYFPDFGQKKEVNIYREAHLAKKNKYYYVAKKMVAKEEYEYTAGEFLSKFRYEYKEGLLQKMTYETDVPAYTRLYYYNNKRKLIRQLQLDEKGKVIEKINYTYTYW